MSPDVSARHLTKTKKNGGALPESVIDHRKRELNVLRDAIDPDALDDGIDLMSPPGTFALFAVVHDSVHNLRIVYKAVSVTNTELEQPLDTPCCKARCLQDPQAPRECHPPLI
jgi:hypothetical protein